MERIVQRPGALDVHKKSVTACVRVWEGRELEEHMAEFRATVQGLLALWDWLEVLGVKQVAMEATGVYWRPVWAILEDRFALTLVNARHVKAVGRFGRRDARCPRLQRRPSSNLPWEEATAERSQLSTDWLTNPVL